MNIRKLDIINYLEMVKTKISDNSNYDVAAVNTMFNGVIHIVRNEYPVEPENGDYWIVQNQFGKKMIVEFIDNENFHSIKDMTTYKLSNGFYLVRKIFI